MLVTCYAIKIFPRSDGIRIFIDSPIDKVVIRKESDNVMIKQLSHGLSCDIG